VNTPSRLFRAEGHTLPFRTAPVFNVTASAAMTVPWKMLFEPRVAKLPTCQ
jgi:hypothetical protein